MSGTKSRAVSAKGVTEFRPYVTRALPHILEYLSRRVSVVGAVEKPGTFELLGRRTVLSILSEAGGLTRDAGEEVIVIRQLPAGDSLAFRMPVEGLFVAGDPKLNMALEPGDIINVPVDKMVAIYVFGQVRNPGALQVRGSSLPMLTQAIAQAGGFTDRANKKKVKLRRKDAAGKETEVPQSLAEKNAAEETPVAPAAAEVEPESTQPEQTEATVEPEIPPALASLLEKIEEESKSELQNTITTMDNATTALRAMTKPVQGQFSWTMRQGIVTIGNVEYWAVIVSLEGYG